MRCPHRVYVMKEGKKAGKIIGAIAKQCGGGRTNDVFPEALENAKGFL